MTYYPELTSVTALGLVGRATGHVVAAPTE